MNYKIANVYNLHFKKYELMSKEYIKKSENRTNVQIYYYTKWLNGRNRWHLSWILDRINESKNK